MTSRYQRVPTADDPLEAHLVDNRTSEAQQQQQLPSYDAEQRPNSRPPLPSRQRNDLEETFGESLDDDDDDDDNHTESQRLLNAPQPHVGSYPSSSSVNTSAHSSSRPAILPVTNDGVFSNMSAKPDREGNKLDETPPAYEDAAADATPPYWQTTIIAPPGMGDIILVESMPVGNLFNFAWNLLVSASFQFVGFMLTYLLHTSHAAKQGSRAGLGITFVQYGFYIRSRGSLDDFELADDGGDGNSDTNNSDQDSTNADIIAYILMLLGWFIIIRAIGDYIRARKMEGIIAQEPSPENIV
ncbi:hypothetical protein BDB00DRAFT_813257 [Zychaea mexicana]|uniref:uncharacterized protein n=1 Tax=Zychaea mexicana TaxID=64656 RepID=UPI0022FE7B39|nr:uncharacterized protein BDB00DRAFT_813257 [Zychaea mexicana]KAI9495725.1 hypothetical protein BDB00DRAFT_813257 [Zychaea mexicana]